MSEFVGSERAFFCYFGVPPTFPDLFDSGSRPEGTRVDAPLFEDCKFRSRQKLWNQCRENLMLEDSYLDTGGNVCSDSQAVQQLPELYTLNPEPVPSCGTGRWDSLRNVCQDSASPLRIFSTRLHLRSIQHARTHTPWLLGVPKNRIQPETWHTH